MSRLEALEKFYQTYKEREDYLSSDIFPVLSSDENQMQWMHQWAQKLDVLDTKVDAAFNLVLDLEDKWEE